jgi:oligogalacturonide transporter
VEELTGMKYESLWGNNNIGYLHRHNPPPQKLTRHTAPDLSVQQPGHRL